MVAPTNALTTAPIGVRAGGGRVLMRGGKYMEQIWGKWLTLAVYRAIVCHKKLEKEAASMMNTKFYFYFMKGCPLM